MDKKIYIKPVCEMAEFEIQDSLLLNCSIGVDNTPQDGIEGRTNMNQGFTDIWGNEYQYFGPLLNVIRQSRFG